MAETWLIVVAWAFISLVVALLVVLLFGGKGK